MPMSVFSRLTVLAAVILSGFSDGVAQEAQPLREEIMRADQTLFSAVFESCDTDAVKALVSEDFEFFHDKWGQIADSRADFVAAIRGSCERQEAGTDFKARREVEPESIAVFAMQNYGALQTGNHRFFRLEPGKPEIPTERAKFMHLWRNEGGRWLLARVISYEHEEASQTQGAQ